MGMQVRRPDRPGLPDPERRAAMEGMLRAGASLDEVATELGYANSRSALVLAHRWGLHTLRRESKQAVLAVDGSVKKHRRMRKHDAQHAAGVAPGPSTAKAVDML